MNKHALCETAYHSFCNNCNRAYPRPGCGCEWIKPALDKERCSCPNFIAREGKWIDVKLALPTIGKRVLVIADNPHTSRKSVFIAKRIPHDTTNPTNPKWHWTQVANDTEITHWQPLPQIPKEL